MENKTPYITNNNKERKNPFHFDEQFKNFAGSHATVTISAGTAPIELTGKVISVDLKHQSIIILDADTPVFIRGSSIIMLRKESKTPPLPIISESLRAMPIAAV
jgi:hypothetical protein